MKSHDRIDVHHHLLPDFYLSDLKSAGVTDSGGQVFRSWDSKQSLELMETAGVATAILSISEPALYPIVHKSVEKGCAVARKINELMADVHARFPKQFGGFAVLPFPDMDGAIKEMEYALDTLKLDGVGVLSNYGEHILGDRYFDEFFDELNKRCGIFHLHPSIPSGNPLRPEFVPIDFFQEFPFNTTRAATNLIFSGTLERCQNLKPILAHMGGTLPYLKFRLDDVFARLVKKDVPFNLPMKPYVHEAWANLPKSIADYFRRFYFDVALAADNICFRAVEEVSPGHTLFGTDAFFSLTNQPKLFAENVERYYTDDDQLSAVNRGNAEKLLPRFVDHAT
jgi:predicted TIM-barrel fold metal-dependent hydrolase